MTRRATRHPWVPIAVPAVAIVLIAVLVVACAQEAAVNADVPEATGQPHLLWADEFSGPAGTPPDPARWNAETGSEWTPGELQCYTDSPGNAGLDGSGHLVLRARRSPAHICVDGATRDYTSARLTSRFDFAGGTLAVRARVPVGRGTWPAIWALGSNYSDVGWPDCGEIDLAEAMGDSRSAVGVHFHGPGFSDSAALGTTARVTGDLTAFHVYSATWTRDRVAFFIDGRRVWATDRDGLPAAATWSSSTSFFAILNVAVGGLAGPPDGAGTWPQEMTVDYVRFYA